MTMRNDEVVPTIVWHADSCFGSAADSRCFAHSAAPGPLRPSRALMAIPGESKLTLGGDKIQPRSLLEALERNFGHPKVAFWGVGSPFGASWVALERLKRAPRVPQGSQKDPQETPKRLQRDPKFMLKIKRVTSEI